MDLHNVSREALAQRIYALIKDRPANSPISRGELNHALRTSSNDKANDIVSEIIKSMIAYRYIDRFMDAKTQVFFWVVGASTLYTPNSKKIDTENIRDYLADLSLPGRVKESRVVSPPPQAPAPTPTQTAQDEVKPESAIETPAETPHKPRAVDTLDLNSYTLADLREKATQTTLDKFFVHLATRLPYFDNKTLLSIFVKVPGMAGARLSNLVFKGSLVEARRAHSGLSIYVLPTKPLPEGYFEVHAPDRVAPQRKPASSPLVTGPASLRDYPGLVSVQPKTLEFRPQGEPVADSSMTPTLSPLHASFSSSDGLTFVRESGQVLAFTAKEQAALFSFLAQLNVPQVLNKMKEHHGT